MSYLVSKDDLIRLIEGEIKVEELTIPERVVLITWIGEDVKFFLQRKRKDLTIDLQKAVHIVKKSLMYCECATCVENAVNEIDI